MALPPVSSSTSTDSVRGLQREVFTGTGATVGQLAFPVDISPSVMPNASVEILVSMGAVTTTSNKFLWSTGNITTFSGRPNPRAFVVYDKDGSGASYSVMGPTLYNTNPLTAVSGYVHFVVTFTSATNRSAVYVNGVYADERTVPTIDGANYINYNGVIGTTTVCVGSTLAYLRVWNKTLSQAEAIALSTGSPAGATGNLATTQC